MSEGKVAFTATEIEDAIRNLIAEMGEQGEIGSADLLGALRSFMISAEIQIADWYRKNTPGMEPA